MTHKMALVKTYPTGAEEWDCPDCGYRFIMKWQPYKRIRLAEGDPHEGHQGSKGGLAVQSAEVEETVSLDMSVWGKLES